VLVLRWIRVCRDELSWRRLLLTATLMRAHACHYPPPAGEMHTLPLPFAATTLWPTASGLLLQNAKQDAADGNGEAPCAAALDPHADLRESRKITLYCIPPSAAYLAC
jgi:hypothetical protein